MPYVSTFLFDADDELIAGGTRIFVFGDVPAGMSPAERQALSQQHGSGLRVEDVVDAAQHTLCYAQAAEDLSQARKMRDDIQQKIDAALRPSAAPEQVHVGGSGGDEAGPSGTPAGRTGRPVVIQRCKKKGTPATLSPLRNDGRFAKRFVGLKEEPGGGSSGEPQRNVRRRLDTDAGEAGGGGRAATENVGPQEIEVIELLD